jgi:peptidoglycan hydrolase-like protein with peptidoglycan-binding domain
MKGFPSVKRALPLIVASLALVLPALASAQVPTTPAPPPPTTPPPPPPAPPASAAMNISLKSGLSDHGHVYVLKGERVVLLGRLKPFVAGEKVRVELFRNGKRVDSRNVKVHKASGGAGQFRAAFTPMRKGVLALRAIHKATAKQAASKTAKLRFSSITPSAHTGSSGPNVRLLQHALAKLHYVTSRGGYYDDATARAIIAYRKVSGMSRITTANRTIFRRLFAGRGGYKLRYPSAGKHVEFDWSRQVLVLADHGVPDRIYHASSGKPSTPTVFGTFSFYSKTPGTNAKGMVDSNYFIRGYAIHGYAEVPTYAASHGCIRVPVPNAYSIFKWIDLGDRIFVYR